MKGLRCLFIALVTAVFICLNVCAYQPEPVEIKGFKGTTPRVEAAFLSSFSDESCEIKKSRCIYESILSQKPELFLLSGNGLMKMSEWKDMTEEELEFVSQISQKIVANLKTADEIIYETAKYVAQNTCYDNDYYYYGRKEYEEVNHNAYDVLTKGSAVCLGYSVTTNTLLQLAGIPCVNIYSPDHVWNMAYNGERWVLVDSTWMSCGYMENGRLYKSGFINDEWFDFTPETAYANPYHIIEDASYAVFGDELISFPCYTLERSFRMPGNITTVGEYAFYNCENAEIIIDNKLEKIGKGAFYGCCGLKGIVYTENAEINEYAFSYAKDTSALTIRGNAKYIGEAAFYECENAEFDMEEFPQSIGEAAFYNCEGLEGVLDLSKVSSLGSYAFCGCSSLTDVIFGKNSKNIPYGCFANCYRLIDIIMENSIEEIEEYAFANCYSINNVYYKGTEFQYRRMDIENTNYSNYYFVYANTEFNYSPYLTLSKSGNKFTARFKGIPDGETVVFAEYRDDALLSTKIIPADKTMIYTLINKTADKVEIFAFEDGLKKIIPAAKAGISRF